MKKFTIENLKADGACDAGMAFVTPLIKVGIDIPNALKAHNLNWLNWAIKRGYDCRSAWIDNVFTWDNDGIMTATAGDFGTATAGYRGIATAGREGTAIAGNWGTATAEDYGTATAGDWGTATAGDGGTATTGREGTATAGRGGTATAGYEGTATAGEGGIIQIKYYDFRKFRLRIKTGYIGEDGLLPNTPYKLDDNNNFVKASV